MRETNAPAAPGDMNDSGSRSAPAEDSSAFLTGLQTYSGGYLDPTMDWRRAARLAVQTARYWEASTDNLTVAWMGISRA